MHFSSTILFFCGFFVWNVCSISKDNQHAGGRERKFRSGKVQQLWDKAERMDLHSVSMTDLYAELKQHDHALMELKVMKSQGEDEDGMIQAKLQREFNGILFKYGIAGNTREDAYLHDLREQQRNKEPFQDRKLNKMWKDATGNGKFSPEELNKLFLEFKHHEDKLTELHALQAGLKEIEKNSIAGDDDVTTSELHSKFKEFVEDVEDNYRRLHMVSKKKNKDDSLPFLEPRVLELWNSVKNGNFTEDERKSLEAELRHFEKRIDKHRYFREELKNSAEKIEFHGGKKEAPAEKLIKHDKLQTKVKDLADKIHKAFVSIKSRLSGGVVEHNEL